MGHARLQRQRLAECGGSRGTWREIDSRVHPPGEGHALVSNSKGHRTEIRSAGLRFGPELFRLAENQVRGAAGTIVKLIPGELLDEQGLVSQRSSGEPVWFSYVLRGNGEETWHPRFTYYGFRYIQVEQTGPAGDNTPGRWVVLQLEGQFVHSSALKTGEFASSSLQINRIHDLILAAVDTNTQSVLTDCPHREKLGWLDQCICSEKA